MTHLSIEAWELASYGSSTVYEAAGVSLVILLSAGGRRESASLACPRRGPP